MNPQLAINLFGGLTIKARGERVTILPTVKAEVLLAYLAVEKRPQGREVMATLFWDDPSREQALSNLRTLITGLRRHLKAYLDISQADSYLETGYQLLKERAAMLVTNDLRQFFPEEMPLNREIMEAYHSR